MPSKRFPWVRRVVLPVLSTVLAPLNAAGQTGPVHDCSTCEIRFERIAVLGGPDLPFEFGSAGGFSVMSDGRYLASTFGASQIAVFSPDGEFERLIGGEGDGPGEFRDIKEIAVGAGDTVYVYEFPAQVTRLTSDLRYIDQIRPEVPTTPQGWTIMPDGGIALVAVEVGTGLRGNKLWQFDVNGRLIASFLRSPRAYHISDFDETVGFLSASRQRGGLWYAKLNEYALRLFVDGRETKTIVRQTDWFEPWQGPLGGEGLIAPKRPSISGVAERDDGRLTVVATVADENWATNRAKIVRGRLEHGLNPDLLPRQLMFDSVVEVIDPETNELVGHARHDDALFMPIGGDGTVVYAHRADDIGRYRINVYRAISPS